MNPGSSHQPLDEHETRRDRNLGVVPLLWGFAFLSYLLRMNIAIAQQYMARELHFNEIEIGFIFSAFLIGYSIFQVPGGVFGDRFGPRLVLAVCGFWWVATTFLTGLIPGRILLSTSAALYSLVVIRFLHGAGEAPTYPVAMDAVSQW